MSPGATTVHKLFGLFIKSKIGDLDERKLKLLTEKFKKGLCLLIIDEFSMESRAMIGLIIDRFRSIHTGTNEESGTCLILQGVTNEV